MYTHIYMHTHINFCINIYIFILGMCEIRSFESNFELSFKIRFDSKNFY